MPVVKFFGCLVVFGYLTSNENPIKSTGSFISLDGGFSLRSA